MKVLQGAKEWTYKGFEYTRLVAELQIIANGGLCPDDRLKIFFEAASGIASGQKVKDNYKWTETERLADLHGKKRDGGDKKKKQS